VKGNELNEFSEPFQKFLCYILSSNKCVDLRKNIF